MWTISDLWFTSVYRGKEEDRMEWTRTDDEKHAPRMVEFLNRYFELSPIIYEFLCVFRLFIAPLDLEKRILERIESAIFDNLNNKQGIIGTFLDPVRYRRRRSDEEPIVVKMIGSESIIGLGDELII